MDSLIIPPVDKQETKNPVDTEVFVVLPYLEFPENNSSGCSHAQTEA